MRSQEFTRKAQLQDETSELDRKLTTTLAERDPDAEYDARRQEKADAEAEREYDKKPKITTYQLTGRGPNMEPNYEFGPELDSLERAIEYRKKLMADPKTPNPRDIGIRTIQRLATRLETKFAEAIDQDEYTNEEDMVQNNLATIIRVAEELSSVLEDNEDMAEWAQEKIAIVKSMIVTVTDYVISQHEQGNVQHTDEDFSLDEKASAKLCRSTKRLGRSDYSSCVSQGLRAHQSKGKGHTDGHGNYLKGKKAKSTQYGGDVKDYDGK